MIIMLSGKRKAGKTTFADMTLSMLGVTNFQRVAFVDMFKEIYATANDIPIIDLHDPDKKEKHRYNFTVFVNQIREKSPYIVPSRLFNALDDDTNYFIDDLRTIEELHMGMKLGAIPFRIECDPLTKKGRGFIFDPLIDNDPLETQLDFSAETWTKLGGGVIYNNTNILNDLRKESLRFIEERIS